MNLFLYQPRNFRPVTIQAEGCETLTGRRGPDMRCGIGLSIAVGLGVAATSVGVIGGIAAGLGTAATLVGLGTTAASIANGAPTNSPSQINNGIGAQYAPGVYQEYLENQFETNANFPGSPGYLADQAAVATGKKSAQTGSYAQAEAAGAQSQAATAAAADGGSAAPVIIEEQAPATSNTGEYIAIGLGVIALGTMIFIHRKK